MAPKNVKAVKGEQKAFEKAKQKVVEDKTFGLKNKNKSKAVQKYIKQVQSNAFGGKGAPADAAEREKAEKKAKQAEMEKQAAFLKSLFKGIENKKKGVEGGDTTNPEAIKESQKINLYVDQRTQKEENMEEWDQEKLEQVIKTKHGAQSSNQTDIICKHFLDAVEKGTYGWFWQCPGGGDSCKYRHCLPPGYVLKKKKKPGEEEEEEDEDAETVEEMVERLRSELPAGGTRVTAETFADWKKRKEEERKEAVERVRGRGRRGG
eukprot:Cvel_20903.t1-p1 / transcript=Cvel_20903.t1 / gene=Cvel_20903 / organism=Chromera_velia_CCMP2878 / gene_product=Zinc finger CCCH domain-containing protein 15, putative / transcript_product=Zinc finger CCCH domain-containing protein 15, putative / location=Cvel_scaffold1917:34100-37070(+) / protein_length=262 / sequence_SO=supercontig / SO=protein_coding / is_pseudo=false